MMGSPLYMSPEQMSSSKKVDVRADIWSMGVVLYELLAGASPFMGESVTEVCAKICQDTPAPLASSTIPPGLDAVVLRCLEKRPEARFASMAELSAALYPFSSADGRVAAERIRRLFAGAPSVETGLEATSLEVASHAIAAAETIAAPRSSAETSTPAVIASTDTNVANTIRHDASTRVTLASPPAPARSPVLALAAAITFAGLVGVGFLLKSSGSETSTQVATAATAASAAPPPSATATPSAAENPSATTSIGVSSIAPLKGVSVMPTASDSTASKPAPEKPHATSTSRPPSAPSKPTATVDLRGDDRH
jgi:serine/threonine-protein kinase